MEISVLLNRWLRREEFPITRSKVFLAHAAASPLPQRVCCAIREYCQNTGLNGQWSYLYTDKEREARKLAASLFGAHEDEIAFTSSTSVGLSLVAGGLPWQGGDNVVIFNGDFPSNIYPWLNLARYGVETRFIPRNKVGAVTVSDLEQIIDNKTRLVSLSSVNFITGYRIDVPGIGKYLHGRGILFCVDAVQSLGALPFDSHYVDFAAAGGHKWLLAPLGSGLLLVKREHFDRLYPVLSGWKSAATHDYLDYNPDFTSTAARYEPGSPNAMGIVGLHQSIQMLMEVGIDTIARRLLDVRGWLVNALTEMGYEVLSPLDEQDGSGIVSFTGDQQSIAALRQHLESHNIIVSMRNTLDGRKCLRVSPHFYNSNEEIEILLSELRARHKSPLVSTPAAVKS